MTSLCRNVGCKRNLRCFIQVLWCHPHPWKQQRRLPLPLLITPPWDCLLPKVPWHSTSLTSFLPLWLPEQAPLPLLILNIGVPPSSVLDPSLCPLDSSPLEISHVAVASVTSHGLGTPKFICSFLRSFSLFRPIGSNCPLDISI